MLRTRNTADTGQTDLSQRRRRGDEQSPRCVTTFRILFIAYHLNVHFATSSVYPRQRTSVVWSCGPVPGERAPNDRRTIGTDDAYNVLLELCIDEADVVCRRVMPPDSRRGPVGCEGWLRTRRELHGG
jgi:hypothetical protein